MDNIPLNKMFESDGRSPLKELYPQNNILENISHASHANGSNLMDEDIAFLDKSVLHRCQVTFWKISSPSIDGLKKHVFVPPPFLSKFKTDNINRYGAKLVRRLLKMEHPTSFLCGRDPSILAGNRPVINPQVVQNLFSKFEEPSTCIVESRQSTNLEVYLRLKPNNSQLKKVYSFQENVLECRVPAGSEYARNVHTGNKIKKKYTFSKIFAPEMTQLEIFNESVKKNLLNFINGQNFNIFTYGTSGSGKTYTIQGTDTNPGIIPRALEYLFRTLPPVDEVPKIMPSQTQNVTILNDTASSNIEKLRNYLLKDPATLADRMQHIQTYKLMQQRLSTDPAAILSESSNISLGVWVSFVEIYNEFVYDLLQPHPGRGKQRPKLHLTQDSKGDAFIKNLTTISVSSGLEAYQMLQYGQHNLNYAATSLNTHSSRSHCIFSVKLVQMDMKRSEARVSCFSFCDLAGSERVKHTQNVGDRLKESKNINRSLYVLGRCVKTIREAQKHNDGRLAPFRDSKLTRMFQKALCGQEPIAMIVNINTDPEFFDESHQVLNFSAIAKDITLEKDVEAICVPVRRRFSQYVHDKYSSQPSTSTSISSEGLSEVDVLRSQVENLCLELQNVKMAAASKEAEIRRELIDLFHNRHEQVTKKWEKRMQELRNSHDTELERVTQQYELKNTNSVIELDSDSDDEKSSLLKKCQEEKASLEDENKKMCINMDLLQKYNLQLTNEVNDLKQQLEEKQQLLLLAEADTAQLEAEKRKADTELIRRSTQVLTLQDQIDNLEFTNFYEDEDDNDE